MGLYSYILSMQGQPRRRPHHSRSNACKYIFVLLLEGIIHTEVHIFDK